MEHSIGIDEAGRGPLAGPVAVGAVVVPHDFDWSLVEGVKDSKKMTPRSRERVYETMVVLREKKALDFAVAFSSSTMIDEWGIVPAIKSALARALTHIQSTSAVGREVEVLLDGGLRAPREYAAQKTIIRGDDTEPVISLASIAAKVERDRIMLRLAKKHPLYAFEVHKGYGTAAHRAAIKKHGISVVHRRTFCKTLISKEKSV